MYTEDVLRADREKFLLALGNYSRTLSGVWAVKSQLMFESVRQNGWSEELAFLNAELCEMSKVLDKLRLLRAGLVDC